MTSLSKNERIDTLDDIFYNNAYQRTIKMKTVDEKPNTYIDFGIEYNDKDRKFKVGDHVRICNQNRWFVREYYFSLLILS